MRNPSGKRSASDSGLFTLRCLIYNTIEQCLGEAEASVFAEQGIEALLDRERAAGRDINTIRFIKKVLDGFPVSNLEDQSHWTEAFVLGMEFERLRINANPNFNRIWTDAMALADQREAQERGGVASGKSRERAWFPQGKVIANRAWANEPSMEWTVIADIIRADLANQYDLPKEGSIIKQLKRWAQKGHVTGKA